jgi:hypothetical protein
MTSAAPKLRADALRNRRRVLDAAAVVFAERGLDARPASSASIPLVATSVIGTNVRPMPNDIIRIGPSRSDT